MDVRVGTYNLLNLQDTDVGRDRYGRLVQVIQDLNVDVLAVQEILGSSDEEAGKVLATLAGDVGMRCEHEPGQPVIARGHKLSSGNQYFYVGLLWRPGISMVPGRLRTFTEDFWHSLVVGVFDLGGSEIAMASYHATPFGRARRADEMERVVSVLTRPDGRPPGLIGADWNSISADRSDGAFYDHDWHADEQWHDDLIYQCRWEVGADGVRRHWTDREPGEVLDAGGLSDAAAVLDAPWAPTVGHWGANDPFGARRIDAIKVTRELAPAIRRVDTDRSELALRASDHLPVVATVSTGLITTE